MTPSGRRIDTSFQRIIVVEDNEADFAAIERGLSHGGLANPIIHFERAEPALAYLRDDEESTLPGMLLLDINLPGMSGLELLEAVKTDPLLSPIPVVMLTTSDDDRAIERAYAAGANSYVQKPVDLGGLVKSLVVLTDYWFSIAVLPKGLPS